VTAARWLTPIRSSKKPSAEPAGERNAACYSSSCPDARRCKAWSASHDGGRRKQRRACSGGTAPHNENPACCGAGGALRKGSLIKTKSPSLAPHALQASGTPPRRLSSTVAGLAAHPFNPFQEFKEVVSSRCISRSQIGSALPRPHRGQCGSGQPDRAPEADRQKQHRNERYSRREPWDGIACRCIWMKATRMTAPGNSGVVRWWHHIVSHGPVLSVLLQAWRCWRPIPSREPETPMSRPGGPGTGAQMWPGPCAEMSSSFPSHTVSTVAATPRATDARGGGVFIGVP
jgi:hypothetical protein